MNTHFCGGEATETTISIGPQNTGCGMEKEDSKCETNSASEKKLTAKSCCDNHHQILQLEDNANVKSFSIEINPVFILSLVHAFVHPVIFTEQVFIQSALYSPTIPDKDVQVLYQTFLI